MIILNDITDRKIWDQFVISNHSFTFFQSWDWGEYQKQIGNSIYRLGIYEGQKLIGVFLIIHISSKKGSFLHLRHGPVLHKWNNYKILDDIIDYMKRLSASCKVDFIRISPLIEHTNNNIKIFSSRKLRESPLHLFDVSYSWNLDLKPTEQEIFDKMEKNGRRHIRRSIREEVKVRCSNKSEDLIEFNRLRNETGERKKFSSCPNNLIESEFNVMSQGNNCLLWFAEYKSKPIAGAMIIYYGNRAFFHFGGSSKIIKNIPCSYLLQWEIIKDAKKRGCDTYNLWGVSSPENSSHPWYGTYLFKKNFGGYLKHYLHAQDLPLTYRYYFSYVTENIRKWQYGF